MGDIDEVKSRLNIIEIVGVRVHLKKIGRNFKGLCPFHNEKTPSFIVSPDRQTWHCFGCGKGGSAIDFVMEYEHMDFVEALETLAEKVGVTLERRHPDSPEAHFKQQIYEVNHLASEFYQYLLTKHTLGTNAREYLKERGMSEKSIVTFGMGYSPNSWDGLLKFLTKKGYGEEIIERAGLIVESRKRYYDRFRGRVMFTLRDHRKNVVGFSGRLIDSSKSLPAGRQDAKYINTPETPVYIKGNVLFGLDVTKEAIQKANEAIIMEGEFDVISSFQEGISNVVAIKGSALTQGHVNLLRRFTERIVFALDSDVAGDAASRRGIEIADKVGLDMKVALIPEGKDPDDAARNSPILLKKAIKEAMPIYDYFIKSALSRFDTSTAFGKKKITDEILPILAKIENSIVQGHYMKQLATNLGIGETILWDGMRKVRSSLQRERTSVIEPQIDKTRREKLEIYVLALLLQGKTVEWLEELFETITIEDIVYLPVHTIIVLLQTWISRHPVFLMKDFADSLPSELVSAFDEAFLWDVSELIEEPESFAKEWVRTMRGLRREIVRDKIVLATNRLKDQEGSGQEGQEPNEDFTKLTHDIKVLESEAES